MTSSAPMPYELPPIVPGPRQRLRCHRGGCKRRKADNGNCLKLGPARDRVTTRQD